MYSSIYEIEIYCISTQDNRSKICKPCASDEINKSTNNKAKEKKTTNNNNNDRIDEKEEADDGSEYDDDSLDEIMNSIFHHASEKKSDSYEKDPLSKKQVNLFFIF